MRLRALPSAPNVQRDQTAFMSATSPFGINIYIVRSDTCHTLSRNHNARRAASNH